MQSVESQSTFRRNCRLHLCDRKINQTRHQREGGSKPVLFFDPEDGGDVFLPNVDRLSVDYTSSYPRTIQFKDLFFYEKFKLSLPKHHSINTRIVVYSLPNIINATKSRRMRWAGHVARTGEMNYEYRNLPDKRVEKIPFGRIIQRQEDNIKMCPLLIESVVMVWIPARWAVMNQAVTLPVQKRQRFS
jgi:hypothetical protein